jgi:hypothetical protein
MIKEYIASAAKFTSDTNTPVLLNYEMTTYGESKGKKNRLQKSVLSSNLVN